MTFNLIGQTTIVEQHFSNVLPTGWSSTGSPTSPIWNLARNESATGNYRNIFDATTYAARFSSAANGNSVYLYIPISFVKDNTYTITFYTKRVCSVEVNTNELPNQTTLLTNQSLANSNCNSNWNNWYQWSFTVISSYTGAGYFQIWTKTIYGGPTSAYLDDLTLVESPPMGLPIELLYFKGEPYERYNHLSWSTASEDNNDYFNIEKTIDGVYYHNIARIGGAGNSNTILYYEYDDLDITNEVCYYRLKQTDYDGKFKYHDIISLDNSKKLRIVVRVINLYGTDVDIDTKGLLILIYDDGSVKKLYNN